MRTDTVIAEIGLEPESLVGFDGVDSLVLELVGFELVEQADAATFLVEIDDHAFPFLRNQLHRCIELPSAIAAE